MNENTLTKSPSANGADHRKGGRRAFRLADKCDDAFGSQASPATESVGKFASGEDSIAPDDEPPAPTAEADRPGASEEVAMAAAATKDAPSAEPDNSPPAETALGLEAEWRVAPSKLPAENAPPEMDDTLATPASPKTAAAIPREEGDTTSTRDATDIVASCEDKGALDGSNAGETIPPASQKVTILPPALQAAINRCMAVRSRHGSFIGWGERSEETAAAALDLVALMTKDYEAFRAVRKAVNEERKKRGERALNTSTSKELLAVFLCAPPSTKAERQECSRFANVISVATSEQRTSANVGEWLKATTLSEALEKARWLKNKRSSKTYSVAITRNKYPHLWESFKTPGVRNAIEKALKSVDESLKKEAPGAR